MSITFSSTIKPQNNSEYPIIDSNDSRGGLHTIYNINLSGTYSDEEDISKIKEQIKYKFMNIGMMVFVVGSNKYYQCIDLGTNSQTSIWKVFEIDSEDTTGFPVTMYTSNEYKPTLPQGQISYSNTNDKINLIYNGSDNWTLNSRGLQHPVWITQCIVLSTGSQSDWTDPIKITGEKGEDGDNYDYIYHRTNELLPQNYTPYGINVDYINEHKQQADNNGKLWTDDPQGISSDWKYEYQSVSLKHNGTWGQYSNATVWSAYGDTGANGEDGTDIEFIFTITKYKERAQDGMTTLIAPPTTQEDDWHGTNNNTLWTDNPTGVDEENRFEYSCVRYKNNGVWGPYSPPFLWSAFGEKGRDGDGLEYIYYLTDNADFNTNPTPDAVTKKFNNEPLTTEEQEIYNEYQNSDEYVNKLEGWYDDPQETNSSDKKYQFVSIRKRKQGIWQEFSDPIIWNQNQSTYTAVIGGIAYELIVSPDKIQTYWRAGNQYLTSPVVSAEVIEKNSQETISLNSNANGEIIKEDTVIGYIQYKYDSSSTWSLYKNSINVDLSYKSIEFRFVKNTENGELLAPSKTVLITSKGETDFDLWKEKNPNGTLDEYLASLTPKTAYDLWLEDGNEGSKEDFLNSLNGKNAYEIAQDNGFTGTKEEWLESLLGKNALSYDIVPLDPVIKIKDSGYSPTTVRCQILKTLGQQHEITKDCSVSVIINGDSISVPPPDNDDKIYSYTLLPDYEINSFYWEVRDSSGIIHDTEDVEIIPNNDLPYLNVINESISVTCNSTGIPVGWTNAETVIPQLYINQELEPEFNVSFASDKNETYIEKNGVKFTITSDKTIEVIKKNSTDPIDSCSVVFYVTKGQIKLSKSINIIASKVGQSAKEDWLSNNPGKTEDDWYAEIAGEDKLSYDIIAHQKVIVMKDDATSGFDVNEITCSIKKTLGTNIEADYVPQSGDGISLVISTNKGTNLANYDSTSKVYRFSLSKGITKLSWILYKGQKIIDQQTIGILKNGTGRDGEDAYTVVIENDALSISCGSDGKPYVNDTEYSIVEVYKGVNKCENIAIENLTSDSGLTVSQESVAPNVTNVRKIKTMWSTRVPVTASSINFDIRVVEDNVVLKGTIPVIVSKAEPGTPGFQGCVTRMWKQSIKEGQQYRCDLNINPSTLPDGVAYLDYLIIPSEDGTYKCYTCNKTFTADKNSTDPETPSTFLNAPESGIEYWKKVKNVDGSAFFETFTAISGYIETLSNSAILIMDNEQHITGGFTSASGKNDGNVVLWSGGDSSSTDVDANNVLKSQENATFKVYKDGTLYCKNGQFEGLAINGCTSINLDDEDSISKTCISKNYQPPVLILADYSERSVIKLSDKVFLYVDNFWMTSLLTNDQLNPIEGNSDYGAFPKINYIYDYQKNGLNLYLYKQQYERDYESTILIDLPSYGGTDVNQGTVGSYTLYVNNSDKGQKIIYPWCFVRGIYDLSDGNTTEEDEATYSNGVYDINTGVIDNNITGPDFTNKMYKHINYVNQFVGKRFTLTLFNSDALVRGCVTEFNVNSGNQYINHNNTAQADEILHFKSVKDVEINTDVKGIRNLTFECVIEPTNNGGTTVYWKLISDVFQPLFNKDTHPTDVTPTNETIYY